jgi:hypothetical protein
MKSRQNLERMNEEKEMSKPHTHVIYSLMLAVLLGACQLASPALTPATTTDVSESSTTTQPVPKSTSTSVPSPTATALPSSEISVTRALLSYNDLVQGFAFTGPMDESAFVMPDDAALPMHIFEGRLELLNEKEGGKIDILKGGFPPELAYLPAFDLGVFQMS